MTQTIENALISEALIGVGEWSHGIFTLTLQLSDLNTAQGCCGYREDHNPRFAEFVKELLNVAGVDEWSKLTGLPVRVRKVEDQIVAIGHIVKDRWCELEDYH